MDLSTDTKLNTSVNKSPRIVNTLIDKSHHLLSSEGINITETKLNTSVDISNDIVSISEYKSRHLLPIEIINHYKRAKTKLPTEDDLVFTDVTFDKKNINLIIDIKKKEVKRMHFINCTFELLPKKFVKDIVLYDCLCKRQLSKLTVKNITITAISSRYEKHQDLMSFFPYLVLNGPDCKWEFHKMYELDCDIYFDCTIDGTLGFDCKYAIFVHCRIDKLNGTNKFSGIAILMNCQVNSFTNCSTMVVKDRNIKLVLDKYPQLEYALDIAQERV
jgi:hypothetical protein